MEAKEINFITNNPPTEFRLFCVNCLTICTDENKNSHVCSGNKGKYTNCKEDPDTLKNMYKIIKNEFKSSKTLKKQVFELESKLKEEYLRSHILSKIIESKLGIRSDDLLSIPKSELERKKIKSIDFKDCKDYKIDLEVKKEVKFEEQKSDFRDNKIDYKPERMERMDKNDKYDKSYESSDEGKDKKDHYRSLKKIAGKAEKEAEPEDKDEEWEEVKIIREFDTQNVLDEYRLNIDQILKAISENKSKNIEKEFEKISVSRKNYYGYISYNNFIKLITKDHEKVLKICKDKRLSTVSINTILSKAFSRVERRMLFNDDMGCKERIKEEELSFYRKNIFYITSRKNSTFSNEEFLQLFLTYDVCLQSFENILMCVLKQFKGKIAYFQVGKSTTEDPYTYFTLQTIRTNDGKKLWHMDCRLANLTELIKSEVITYCVFMFKRLYSSIFGDNILRKEFMNSEYLGVNELKQLYSNISLISDYYKLNTCLRRVVLEVSKLKITDADSVNLFGDDIIVKNEFKNYNEFTFTKDVFETRKSLFENVRKEDEDFFKDC